MLNFNYKEEDEFGWSLALVNYMTVTSIVNLTRWSLNSAHLPVTTCVHPCDSRREQGDLYHLELICVDVLFICAHLGALACEIDVLMLSLYNYRIIKKDIQIGRFSLHITLSHILHFCDVQRMQKSTVVHMY